MISQAVSELELLEQLISGDVHELDMSGQLLWETVQLSGQLVSEAIYHYCNCN